MHRTRRVLILLSVGLAFTSLSHAQRAGLSGAVSDQAGNPVSGAKITLLNLDQGLRRDAVTNQDGLYTLPLLQPGRYLVTAQKDGFVVAEFENMILHVGESRGLNISLRLGAAPVEIQVSANPQAVETVSSTLGQLVSGNEVRDAPLDGRDIRDLALLQPGVTPTDLDFSRNRVGTFNVSGNRADSVEYLLDGGLNNDLIDNHPVYVPNPDTVAEFRILTSNYPAEYGRNSGGIVTVATQSGTNALHGGIFDFFRNDALDANSFINKNSGLPRNTLKRNQFGGTLGGPLSVPHVVDGKDRFFFFIGYQGQRQIQDLSEHNVPAFTPAELQGNFSQAGLGGTPDPNVAAFLQANPFFQPDTAKAAQAIIDPAHLNSVASNYIKAGLIPVSASGFSNSEEPATINSDELTTKFDFDLDAKNKLAVTLGFDRTDEITPFDYADAPGFSNASEFHDYFINFAYTHIFNPNLLNELKVTAQRGQNSAENPAVTQPRPRQLGIGITPDLASGPTNLIFDNGLTLGFSPIGPQSFTDNTFSYSDTLSWSRGRHSLKFGGGLSAYQNNTFVAFYADGQFAFVGVPGLTSGNSFADFLLGLPVQFNQDAAANSNIRSKFYYGFGQDDWRLRKNLVVSLGLRYEYSSPKSDTQGRTFSIIPGEHSKVFVNAPVDMVFPGDAGAPRGVNFPDRNDWAPRIGFAWDPRGNGKSSLRGAFGVFYDILKGEDNLQFNGKPPFYSSAGFGFPPLTDPSINYLADPYGSVGATDPFPSRQPPANINFLQAGFLPIGGSNSIFVVDSHLRTPYTYQYHLTYQRQLGGNMIAEGSYVGSSSHGLTALVDINPFVLGTFNRVLNLTAGNSTCDSATPFLCSYASLFEFKNATTASYNSLVLSLKKQFARDGILGGSYFTIAYTYSHNLDNASGFENRNNIVPYYQPNLFRSSSDMDLRNRVVFSGGIQVPAQRLWQNGPKRLTDGWQVFPIVSWRSGFPLDVFASLPSQFDFTSPGPSGAGDANLVRANLVAPIKIFDPHTIQTINGQTGNYWFDPRSFSDSGFPTDAQAVADPTLRTYGSLPRNFFRGPGAYNINLAFSKTTPLTERLGLELRADFFNLLNHTEFVNPDTNISSPTFGRELYTNAPRMIQLAARFSF